MSTSLDNLSLQELYKRQKDLEKYLERVKNEIIKRHIENEINIPIISDNTPIITDDIPIISDNTPISNNKCIITKSIKLLENNSNEIISNEIISKKIKIKVKIKK